MLSDQEARRDQPIIAEFRQKETKKIGTTVLLEKRGYAYELWLSASEYRTLSVFG